MLLKELVENRKIPLRKFFSFPILDGTLLYGYQVFPPNFDPSKLYPVLLIQYSGPNSQYCSNVWSISWADVLVQQGFIVACVDGRGTGKRGREFKKCTYKQLGVIETEDQIAAAKYLSSFNYVDSTRIGIYGWSFGGFIALNCIFKAADLFKLAVSIAPVTDWQFYDTIYTECFNGDPRENYEGYHQGPLYFANHLKGKLLILHGTGDDNVHIANTYSLVNELVRAEKNFELMVYPDQKHGMGSGRTHLYIKVIKFIQDNL